MNKEAIKEAIIENLKEVYDPEIPINVYDLGLIYEINVQDNFDVHVIMTLTSPTCPTADYLKMMIEEAVAGTSGVKEVDVHLTFEPKWGPHLVAQEAKEELGLADAPAEDLAVQSVFQGDQTVQKEAGVLNENTVIKEKVCFNCGATDEIRPVFDTYFKGEKTFICSKCLVKFD